MIFLFRYLVLLVCLPLLQIAGSVDTVAQTPTAKVSGYVRDETGAAVAGARVELHTEARVVQTTTSTDGSFSFTEMKDGARLTVEAPGFAVFSQTLKNDSSQSTIEVVLLPASIREQLTITATRIEAPLAATAASVRLLSSADLSTGAALTIDDALRQVPGFQLFRRTGSRTANPTSQGVSLRGVGASGASRALVLADGIPFADPFGGWVYWDRLPRAAVSQVEVVRGGVSDLYGSNALGGVINILTHPNEGPRLSFESSYGNQNTPNASLYAATRLKKFTASLAGEVFQTDGFINVRKDDRGLVDTPVASRHQSVYVEIGYSPSQNSRLFLRPSYFAESRNNGTPLQTNRTRLAELDGGVNWNPHRVGRLSLRGYLSTQNYDQVFSAIASNRNSETLTRTQRVPAQAAGFMIQWSRLLGERQSLVGGFEAREVRGASDEIVYSGGNASSLVGAGGRQRSYALFFRDTVQLNSKLSISGGTRVDFFRNFNGLSVSRGILPGSVQNVTRFPDVTEATLSPQFSLVYHANEKLSLFGSFNQAFRAPTLNELYRSFRLGNVLTLANENLRRERATGGEAGARLSLWMDRFDLRASFFSTSITDPIANVTLSSSPSLITRQRQNLGRTRSLGFEADSSFRFQRDWNVNVGYLFSAARIVDFPANTLLEGLLIPQTPRHSLTFQISYAGSKHYKFGIQGRASGSQFEDDQNLLPLRGFFTFDAYVSRSFGTHWQVFVAGENVLNSRYEVGRTPVVTVGSPALFRLGLKLNY
jgi:outer membrane receptor protein involved in Fe transport